MEIGLAEESRLIRTDPQQMLSLLLSTYEAAIQRSNELLQSQDELKRVNEHLEDLVDERTRALSAEIAERRRLQDELRARSSEDELTGLLNRRGFMTLAEQHWRRAVRTGQEFAVLYMDLDGLKQINDARGHAAGDEALRLAARALQLTCRESDILARIGGDEFAVLLADCQPGLVPLITARLEGSLTRLSAGEAPPDQVSMSVGFAQFDADHRANIEDLLKQADARMYAHKQRRSAGGSP